ncbi:MAG: FMN-binding protein [Gammaproteobacteria bacterium]|nr:MAG: FMN-binding protein [Gammaproteobacteria bacterium]
MLILPCSIALAKGVYQTGPEFIAEVFGDAVPEVAYLYLTPARKEVASKIMNRQVRGLRTRYWRAGDTTVWIMEEIGKELPITIGVVVRDNRIAQVKILAFRESRGWEVRYPAFTAQYQDVKITDDFGLDTHIDGITGATLSVRAVTKVATLALYYHQQTTQQAE